MRVYTAILILLSSICTFAQSDATFSVAKKKKVFIECKYDTLAGDKYYYFKVYGASTKELIPGKFAGGQVWLNDTAVCIHTSNKTTSDKKYQFELFLRRDNSIVFSRKFIITPNVNTEYTSPPPTIFTQRPDILFDLAGNTYGNKTSSKDSLQGKVNKVLAQLWPRSLSHSRVTSKLKIDFVCQGKTTTLSAGELKLSNEMIAFMNTMDTGCYLILYTTYHSFNDPPEDSNAGPYRFDVR